MFSGIIPKFTLQKYAKEWLHEDIPSFDLASVCLSDREATAVMLCKSPGMMVGCPIVDEIFNLLDCKVIWSIEEGQIIENCPVQIAVIKGKAAAVLQGERTALNIFARLSSMASNAKRIADKVNLLHFKGRIAGTRKCTPGLRLFEKYALMMAGCDTHRFDLSSCLMIKDNHIDAIINEFSNDDNDNGDMQNALNLIIRKKSSLISRTCKVEVECRSEDDAIKAAQSGSADIIMLDNFGAEEAKRVAGLVKSKYPNIIIEVSGGINNDNVSRYVDESIDLISMGCLTQGPFANIDLSLKISREDGKN